MMVIDYGLPAALYQAAV